MFYTFTVLLDRVPTDDEIEAGMRTPTGVSGIDDDPPAATMSVDEVSSWSEAFAAGVAEAEELGVRVIGFAHDADDDYVSEEDLAVRFGFSEQYVLELATDVVGPGGFPPRATSGDDSPLGYWRWGPVREWFREHFGSEVADRFDREIDAAQVVKAR
ncbi:hypothetical protein AB5J62_38615 [Amycolatopsis sp. cg5]|uniref:hypothetical protein n=1 Tax=Amycolatopsis sp. cg5 TaxID=3238802 RepID=UPI0035241E2D